MASPPSDPTLGELLSEHVKIFTLCVDGSVCTYEPSPYGDFMCRNSEYTSWIPVTSSFLYSFHKEIIIYKLDFQLLGLENSLVLDMCMPSLYSS